VIVCGTAHPGGPVDAWYPFSEGRTIGGPGPEAGDLTILDEEHPGGSRITLARAHGGTRYSITCGIYGCLMHTRYFECRALAEGAFAEMKSALARIIDDPRCHEDARRAADCLRDFLDRFPT